MGFQSFLYLFWLSNEVVENPDCILPTSFYDYNMCINESYVLANCDNGCSTWPWCIDSTCNVCFSQFCSRCSGFSLNDCNFCENPSVINCPQLTGLNYKSGKMFSCAEYIIGFTLYDGFCLLELYKYDQNNPQLPVIDIQFNIVTNYFGDLFEYGVIYSLAQFSNPAQDNLMLVKSRGLYFHGISYLQADSSVALNYQFSIAIWKYSMDTTGSLYDITGSVSQITATS